MPKYALQFGFKIIFIIKYYLLYIYIILEFVGVTMANQLKKFCKITRYIEQIDGELSQVISDLCLERIFIPRGANGITFLYPADKAYRKDIVASAYSNNPEKAIQIIESLIISDYLPRPGDFVLKKDDIPNLLHQRIEVTSADAASVKLKCGATLHPDSGFAPISTRENMAVYHIKGAQIPLNGPKATMKYMAKRKIPSKLGGDDGSDHINSDVGRKLYDRVRRMTLEECRNGKPAAFAASVTILFLRYLMANHPDRLKELVHTGRLSPVPLACFFTAVHPLAKDDLYVANFVNKHEGTDYHLVSKSDDVLKEFQNVLEECYTKSGVESDIHEDEAKRRELQKDCARCVPLQAIGRAHKAYGDYYKGSKNAHEYLALHELTFIVTRILCDAKDEATGEQIEAHTVAAFDEHYMRVAKTPTPILVDVVRKGGAAFDPAHIYSGFWSFLLCSFFLGGPMNPKEWDSEELGSSDMEVFDEPTHLDESNQINLHAITRKMFGSGAKAKTTVGGLRELLAQLGE